MTQTPVLPTSHTPTKKRLVNVGVAAAASVDQALPRSINQGGWRT
jgi:hypothetical protein